MDTHYYRVMAQPILKGAANKVRLAEYYQFVAWCATPRIYRNPATIEEWCAEHKIARSTVQYWKVEDTFEEDRRRALQEWTKELTPDVLGAIYHSARAGSAPSQKLWMQVVEDFTEKREERKVHDVPQDVRSMLLQLHAQRLQERAGEPPADVFTQAAEAVRQGEPA